MNRALFFVCLFIFFLCISNSYSTTVINCQCSNNTKVYKDFKLICNNSTKLTRNSYSCYREIFIYGRSRHRLGSLWSGDCHGPTLDPRISNAFKNIDIYTFDISYHGIIVLSPNDLQFNTLRTFNASHNRLEKIPKGLFIVVYQYHNCRISI